MFLLFSACGIYLLNGFLIVEERKKVLIIQIVIALWLTIYIFASILLSSKYSYTPGLTGYMDSAICFLLSALSLSFAFWNEEKRIYIFMPFIFFLAIVMTRSLFAVFVASLIFAISLFILGAIQKRTVAVLFTMMGIGSFYFLIKSSYFLDKLFVWKTALYVIKDNFLLGVGFNNYKSVSLSYGIFENVDVLYCDNIFLQVLAESGVFGLLFFLAILAVFLFCIAKEIKLEKERNIYLFVLISVISFLIYNSFNSSSFVSTNMLLFFFLLSFPLPRYLTQKRNKRLNVYILAALCVPLIFASGAPLYARQEYRKGLSFFAGTHFIEAKDSFIKSLSIDYLNPEYSGRLSEVYFALYQKKENKIFLKKSISWANYASNLSKNNGKYYYQLAWLYHFEKSKERASHNIMLAIEKDPFNPLYQEACETILM
jgi:O-antigen ligase